MCVCVRVFAYVCCFSRIEDMVVVIRVYLRVCVCVCMHACMRVYGDGFGVLVLCSELLMCYFVYVSMCECVRLCIRVCGAYLAY